MSERLTELLRQRSLLQEHLAWLDREIAQESGASTDIVNVPATSTTVPPLPARNTALPKASNSSLTANDSTAENILHEYQNDPRVLGEDTRKGCLRLALIGGTIGLLLAGIVYVLYARYLGRWW
ncbi:MAG: hypothetical protein QM790_06770 [Nibricoccus sp.]